MSQKNTLRLSSVLWLNVLWRTTGKTLHILKLRIVQVSVSNDLIHPSLLQVSLCYTCLRVQLCFRPQLFTVKPCSPRYRCYWHTIIDNCNTISTHPLMMFCCHIYEVCMNSQYIKYALYLSYLPYIFFFLKFQFL